MATPGEKLAASLDELRKLQADGKTAIRTKDLTKTHRDRLVKNGFLMEVAKGWFVVSNPSTAAGDSTPWFTSYWKFCSEFLKDRFADKYCLSAEQSLMIHAGNASIPKQLVIRATEATNYIMPLLYETSMFMAKTQLPNNADIIEKDGLRILTLPSALIHCSPIIFKNDATEARIALSQIGDVSEILGPLLDGGHSKVAGRLAGAFRNIGRVKDADTIVKTMRSLDYDVRENDPFEGQTDTVLSIREKSPYVNRMRLLWNEMRPVVMEVFPSAPGIPSDTKAYLKSVEDLYKTDAYHSLSIEKYQVSAELIEKVRTGKWDKGNNEEDRKHEDALAARGYYLAKEKVKESLKRVLAGFNSGKVADNNHGDWYSELFAPSVIVGIIKPSDLAGYRNQPVYIANARHVPPSVEAVRDTMPVLFQLLEQEEEASVRAVLGHFFFVYIHPYRDGNGRIARFLLNVMLASGGYPWTVIPVEMREEYMAALERASVDKNIKPFAKFVARLVKASMDGNPFAREVS
ncbi:Fic family protein [Bacteroidota bacterium]